MSNITEKPEFTKLEVTRIIEVSAAIREGKSVHTDKFDRVIGLLDRKKPELSFEELFAMAHYYDIMIPTSLK